MLKISFFYLLSVNFALSHPTNDNAIASVLTRLLIANDLVSLEHALPRIFGGFSSTTPPTTTTEDSEVVLRRQLVESLANYLISDTRDHNTASRFLNGVFPRFIAASMMRVKAVADNKQKSTTTRVKTTSEFSTETFPVKPTSTTLSTTTRGERSVTATSVTTTSRAKTTKPGVQSTTLAKNANTFKTESATSLSWARTNFVQHVQTLVHHQYAWPFLEDKGEPIKPDVDLTNSTTEAATSSSTYSTNFPSTARTSLPTSKTNALQYAQTLEHHQNRNSEWPSLEDKDNGATNTGESTTSTTVATATSTREPTTSPSTAKTNTIEHVLTIEQQKNGDTGLPLFGDKHKTTTNTGETTTTTTEATTTSTRESTAFPPTARTKPVQHFQTIQHHQKGETVWPFNEDTTFIMETVGTRSKLNAEYLDNRDDILDVPGCKLVPMVETEVRCNNESILSFDEIRMPEGTSRFSCYGCRIKGNKLDKRFCKFAKTTSYGLYSAVFFFSNITEISSGGFDCNYQDHGRQVISQIEINRIPDSRLILSPNICGMNGGIGGLIIRNVKYITTGPNSFQNCSIRKIHIEEAELEATEFEPDQLLKMKKTPGILSFRWVRFQFFPKVWSTIYRRSILDNGCYGEFDLGGNGTNSINCDYRSSWLKEYNDMEKRLGAGEAFCRYPDRLTGHKLAKVRWQELVAISTPLSTTTEVQPRYVDIFW